MSVTRITSRAESGQGLAQRTKVCEVCGADISKRPGPAKYCVPCSLLTKRQRALVKAGVLSVEEATRQRSR
ncbi:MAG: hypothetical protein IMX01_00215 [Limnochordaceae bacterium]|nr:hypothetical protein [Limnochordaceae bacterium]